MTHPSRIVERTLAGLTLAIALSGCYRTTVSAGKPAAPAAVQYDEKWHHGLVWGVAEVSGPYSLKEACPQGWGEVQTQTSFLNGFTEVVTFGIYAPQTVTVRCTTARQASATSSP
jgi:hypothetical protein